MSAHERERLAGYLDDELSPAERSEVEAHLEACPECRTLLADMGAVDDEARGLSVDAPEGYFETFPGKVRERVAQEGGRRAAAPRPAVRKLPRWTWAAAAALALAVVTPLTLLRMQSPAASPRARMAEPPEPRSVGNRLDEAASDRDAVVAEARAPRALPDDDAAAATELPERQARRETRAQQAVAEPEFAVAPAPVPAAPPPQAAVAARPRAKEEAAPLEKDAVGRLASSGLAAGPGEAAEGVASEEKALAQGDAEAANVPMSVNAPLGESVAAPRASDTGRRRLPSLEVAVEGEDGRRFAELSQDNLAFADAATWRERREAWRRFTTQHPDSPHANEARVQVIECGLQAWHAGGDARDLTQARRDAAAYLARDDATLGQRVQRALDAASP